MQTVDNALLFKQLKINTLVIWMTLTWRRIVIIIMVFSTALNELLHHGRPYILIIWREKFATFISQSIP